MNIPSRIDSAFKAAMMQSPCYSSYSARQYLDMKDMFLKGYMLALSEQDFGVIEKEQDFGQMPKQLELF